MCVGDLRVLYLSTRSESTLFFPSSSSTCLHFPVVFSHKLNFLQCWRDFNAYCAHLLSFFTPTRTFQFRLFCVPCRWLGPRFLLTGVQTATWYLPDTMREAGANPPRPDPAFLRAGAPTSRSRCCNDKDTPPDVPAAYPRSVCPGCG